MTTMTMPMTPPLPSKIGQRKIELLGFSQVGERWERARTVKGATAWEVWLAWVPKGKEANPGEALDDWLADVIHYNEARRIAEDYAKSYRCEIEQNPPV
jgi:hypothetical protein